MRRRSPLLLLAASAALLLSTASLIAGLRHALRREPREPRPEADPREAERKRIREALGDMLAPPIDFNNRPAHLRPRPDLPDADTLRRSLPYNERPIWHDLREERDSGY